MPGCAGRQEVEGGRKICYFQIQWLYLNSRLNRISIFLWKGGWLESEKFSHGIRRPQIEIIKSKFFVHLKDTIRFYREVKI
ncbi:hypothetical protein B1H10_01590 [candidate division KSB1 bacterium 4484_188]|nr:MAG: hypothetical protein B1H10_01590 [candidate division KSB1 bacterium 4484_188]